MTNPSVEEHRQLARKIASVVTDREMIALREWVGTLLKIANSNLPVHIKAKDAIAASTKSEVMISTVTVLGRELKRFGWEERGLKGRLAFGGAAIGLIAFGGQSAGIAALGTAIGVPLWVVLGGGAALMGVFYEEWTGKKPPTSSDQQSK